jgi:hypothetical protein
VCNLYSITTNQEAIRALFRVINRYVGNLPPMPGAFPRPFSPRHQYTPKWTGPGKMVRRGTPRERGSHPISI